MKVTCIADTHDSMDLVKLPKADLLLHAGDWTYQGKTQEVIDFNTALLKNWAEKNNEKGTIIVPGNHDFLAHNRLDLTRKLMCNAKILVDESITIEGHKIYGFPWTPLCGDWAFMHPSPGERMKALVSAIPSDTEILISHGGPYGILDQLDYGEHIGCKMLADRIRTLSNLKYHIFGHIHEGYGIKKSIINGRSITSINCSQMTGQYNLWNKPIVINI